MLFNSEVATPLAFITVFALKSVNLINDFKGLLRIPRPTLFRRLFMHDGLQPLGVNRIHVQIHANITLGGRQPHRLV